MSKEFFVTQEVGSLAKPGWRVKGVAGRPIGESDVNEAKRWGGELQIDAHPLLMLLKETQTSGKRLSPQDKDQLRYWAAVYATRLQETAGLDVVYDGEQDRSEMYEHAVRRSIGFEERGLVRSFDNKYYTAFACVEEPRVKIPWHTQELLRLQRITERDIKVPLTGPYTLAAWTLDEHYGRNRPLGQPEAGGQARRELILSIARNLVRPNIESLIQAGAKWIQIDEPAATTVPHEVPLFVEAFNEATRGLDDCQFSVHICFSDYSKLFPYIEGMKNCSQYSLEFANKDPLTLGTQEGDRPGYDVLKLFNEYNVPGRIGLGVSNVHSDVVEPPELVRDRILYAADILQDPRRVNPSPDCGLRTRTWDIAFAKLSSVVQGARLAEELL